MVGGRLHLMHTLRSSLLAPLGRVKVCPSSKKYRRKITGNEVDFTMPTVAELKVELKKHGLSMDGLKADLQSRLQAHVDHEEEERVVEKLLPRGLDDDHGDDVLAAPPSAALNVDDESSAKEAPPPPPTSTVEDTTCDDAISNDVHHPPPFASMLDTACTALERLRSLHAEREACALLASSILAHPFGSNDIGGGSEIDNGGGLMTDIDGGFISPEYKIPQQQRSNNSDNSLFRDALHPRSLPGGVRDAWASLSRSARPLNVIAGGEVDDIMDDLDEVRGHTTSNLITAAMIERELANERRHENEEYGMATGQLSYACRTAALQSVITREAELIDLLEKDASESSIILERMQKQISDAGNVTLLDCFYAKLNEVKVYHSTNVTMEGGNATDMAAASITMMEQQQQQQQLPSLLSGQKRKHGHPVADGYDISSMIAIDTIDVRSGEVYSPEELFGKYMDFVPIYDAQVRGMRHAFATTAAATSSSSLLSNVDMENNASMAAVVVSYMDFLSILSKGLNIAIPESSKLKDRRKYARFLHEIEKYLIGFLQRTSPFLDVTSEVIVKAIKSFNGEWMEKGGVDGWECRIAEAVLDKSSLILNNVTGQSTDTVIRIDLSKYATASDLVMEVSGDELKFELDRLGIKCGGTVKDRAERLFLTKDTPFDKLPTKIFAKKKGGTGNPETNVPPTLIADASATVFELVADRRVDIARQEAIVTALLDQLRPTLDSTRRRIERRMTQTDNERDQELDEEINGASTNFIPNPKGEGGGGNGSDEDDDEDDAPIYNPKNVPLDWNGKPIPYWLFKLHGLNHFYSCEVCGNESYRGRRNFEKHFAESRHAYGMRCLGIPNTKHFHGVTKIADAQELWGRLSTVLEGQQFDVDQEEYEDSHGNVVNRVQYEDLARQGML